MMTAVVLRRRENESDQAAALFALVDPHWRAFDR